MAYQPLTKPRQHQVTARERRLARPSSPSSEDVFAWLMEYGTGKSKVVCDEFGEREEARDLQDLLIVSGAGSYRNWDTDKTEDELSEFHKHLSLDLQDRLLVGAWVSGSGVTQKKKLDALLRCRDRPRALLVNIEALSTVKKARDLCRAFLERGTGRRAMMAIDECTSIKDQSSERSKFCLELGHGGTASCRRLLTGLVNPNSPMDLYSQFEFLDWRILGQRSFWAYQQRYAVMRKIEIPIPGKFNPDGTPRKRGVNIEVAFRNVPELQERIAPYSYRVLAEDCLDLPPLTYSPLIEVELSPEQARHYKELREEATTQLDNQAYVTATMVLTRNLRLQQLLCGFIVDEDGIEHDIPSRRGGALMRVLGEHAGKAIIWVPYHRPLQRIVEALSKEYGPNSVAQFHGKNKSTRGAEESRFLGDPGCRFMVSTEAAGGRGNTWVVATLMIFFANDHNLELRMNAERRFYRDGQRHPCTIVDFTARGTNEIKTVHALRKKIDMASEVMGDSYRSWLI